MQQDQIQKLTQLIQNSRVLRNDERDVWLAMIPVMNDKQAADLFNILNSKPTPKTNTDSQSRTGIDSQVRSTSLRHITNLPNDFSQANQQRQTRVIQEPSVVRRAEPPANLAEVIKHRVEEKELPAPEELIEIGSGHQNKPPINLIKPIPGQSLKPDLKKTFPFQGSQNYIPLDEVMKQREIDRSGQKVKLEVPNEIEKGNNARIPVQNSELANLPIESYSKEIISSANFSSIKGSLTSMVRNYGYFPVLFKFEQSPLYKDYLETGKAWLTGNGESAGASLNKEQFEQVADLLRSLQVSQTK